MQREDEFAASRDARDNGRIEVFEVHMDNVVTPLREETPECLPCPQKREMLAKPTAALRNSDLYDIHALSREAGQLRFDRFIARTSPEHRDQFDFDTTTLQGGQQYEQVILRAAER